MDLNNTELFSFRNMKFKMYIAIQKSKHFKNNNDKNFFFIIFFF